jgi:hypothetical protein
MFRTKPAIGIIRHPNPPKLTPCSPAQAKRHFDRAQRAEKPIENTSAEGRFLKVGWAVPTDLMIKGKKLVTQSVPSFP